MVARVPINQAAIADFCRRWKITELSLFGSVLREDFRADSDVDVLVAFEKDAPWSLWEWPDMMEELKAIFGREIDLVERRSVTNAFRRHHILTHREVIYAAG